MESRYPTGKDSTIKSACAASSATRPRPAADSRLAVTDFFPAWYAIAYKLLSGPGRASRNGGMVRLVHPPRGSPFVNSAALSAKDFAQKPALFAASTNIPQPPT